MRKTGKVDELELNLISDADIERLERVKSLLAEIQELKNEIFGKKERLKKVESLALKQGAYLYVAVQSCFKSNGTDGEKKFADWAQEFNRRFE